MNNDCSRRVLWSPQIDEELVKCSGKFLILDRMLPALKKRGHKVAGMGSTLFLHRIHAGLTIYC